MSDPVVIFDLEMSGLEMSHDITQIAAATFRDGQCIDQFECKLTFNLAEASPEALKIQGYSEERWAYAIHPSDACRNFSKWLKKFACVERISKRTGRPFKIARLAGYNAAAFDVPRLHKLFETYNEFLPADYSTLDVLQLVRWYFFLSDGSQPADHKLGTICEFFKINLNNAHDAAADCIATAAVAREICKRMEVLN